MVIVIAYTLFVTS